jgi:thiol-disulfide isomerase/thioredoxin
VSAHKFSRALAVLLWTFGLAAVLLAQSPSPGSAAQSADPKFAAAIERGEATLKLRMWRDALDAFKEANALQGNKSALAFFGMGRAHHGLGAFKAAADACNEGLKYSFGDLELEGALHNQRGMALYALYQQDDRAQQSLKDAVAEFRLAIAYPDPPKIAWYNLGVALFRLNHEDDARAALQRFVQSGAPDVEVQLARKMLERPRRDPTGRAPDFIVTTLDGTRVTSKELAGKTIVLDFWGTWCAPCRAATPDLVKFANKYVKDPNFVMIGISSDMPKDAQVLRDYITKHKMAWLQRHDLPPEVIPVFDVKSFPTYIVIDGKGIVRERIMGWPGASYGSTIAPRASVISALDAAVQKSLQGNR